MTSPLTTLISALEQAKEPSRELDMAIIDALGRDPREWGEPHQRGYDPKATYFTASLDAKLPNEDQGYWEITGARRYLEIPTSVPNRWRAEFWPYADKGLAKASYIGWGATEAVARRIAALKALQAGEKMG